MDQRIIHKFLMIFVIIATLTTVLSLERRDRQIETEIESNKSTNIKNSLNNKDNKILETERKISQMHDKDDILWDDGIIMSSAGNGKEKKLNHDDDDEKKTLAQQVKEGKYGLIQNELYSKEPKRPGIISYLSNSEVPDDTKKNFGGLDEDEIWLAENHVLVIRGGNFLEHKKENQESKIQKWPPIDNYEAPKRQVKIPNKPKIPPPFPIQLSDNGPIQIIGINGTTQDNITMDYEDLKGSKGYLPGEGPFFSIPPNDSLASPDFIKSINGSRGLSEKKGKTNSPLGLPNPFFNALPPGAVFVLPPENTTDYDEDDQSIYYPPPYSFFYPQDNTTAIPPGPLVPGIILPPPPDFFSPMEEKKSQIKSKTKRPTTTPIPKTRATYLPPRNIGTKLHKTTTATTISSIKIGTVPINIKNFGKIKLKQTTHKPFFVEITTPSVKSTTQLSNNFGIKPAIGNTIETSTEKNNWNSVNNKHIPLSAYYATTISSVEQSIEATPASIKNIITTKNTGKIPSKASYYFYEETTNEPSTVNPSHYYRTTTSLPLFKIQSEQEKKKYYEIFPSRSTSKDINVKLIDSIDKNPQVYHYNEAETSENHSYQDNSSKNRLHTAPIYYENLSGRSLNSYYTTQKPKSFYNEETTEYSKKDRKPKPVYQFSFEAAGYSKRDKQKKELASYNEYQDIQSVSDQYDYEGTEAVSNQQIRTERIPSERIPLSRIPSQKIPYKSQSFYPTTVSPFSDTTLDPHQAYFTRQDEQFLDDVTKEYFTAFGKKLASKSQSTTPFYGKSSTVTEKPKYNYNSNNYDPRNSRIKVHYGDQSQGPFSLKDDTIVNYKRPLPSINPDSEFIYNSSKIHYTESSQKPYSVKDDTLVNYRRPLPPINPDSEFIYNSSKIHYSQPQKPYNLKDDTFVNYRNPLPTINPDSEFINNSPPVTQEYQNIIPVENQVRDYRPQNYLPLRNYGSQRIQQTREQNEFVSISDSRDELYPDRSLSLESDTEINYRNPRPIINPDAEFITPIHNTKVEKTNSYFAYRLPGDGGHFYFLTPQAIAQRQDNGYVYTKPRTSRLLRHRRGPASNI